MGSHAENVARDGDEEKANDERKRKRIEFLTKIGAINEAGARVDNHAKMRGNSILDKTKCGSQTRKYIFQKKKLRCSAQKCVFKSKCSEIAFFGENVQLDILRLGSLAKYALCTSWRELSNAAFFKWQKSMSIQPRTRPLKFGLPDCPGPPPGSNKI